MGVQLLPGEVDCGAVGFRDRGDWQEGFKETVDGIEFNGYAQGDVVHKPSGVYASLTDDNTTDPDTASDGRWRRWLDNRPVVQAVADASKAAQDALHQAAACKTQTDLASELNANPWKTGEDGYLYVWNTTTKQYDKTDCLVQGGMMYPVVENDECDLVISGGSGADNMGQDECDFIVNF